MFGIGIQELILILVVALIVFGPKQLPEVAKSIGRGIREIKKITSEVSDITNLDSSEKSTIKPISPSRQEVKMVIKEEDEKGNIIEDKKDEETMDKSALDNNGEEIPKDVAVQNTKEKKVD